MIKINPEQSFDIFDGELKSSRRIYSIPLKKLSEQGQEYQVSGTNFYYFKDPITEMTTVGNIASVQVLSDNQISHPKNGEIFTKFLFFGSIRTYGGISGHIVDDLEMEDITTNNHFYLGNIEKYPVYVRCNYLECDFYYSEILAGRLYVGYLYTVINKDSLENKKVTAPDWKEYIQAENFCPIKLQSSYEATSMVI